MVQSNLGKVTANLINKMKGMEDAINDKLIRTIATTERSLIKERIHEDGKKADGSQIGTYTNPYLKPREKKYNRSSDSKIIFSLTRQMESDFTVIATNNGWGLGFNNPLNTQKSEWVQHPKNKPARIVYSLTASEKDAIQPIVNTFLKQYLK